MLLLRVFKDLNKLQVTKCNNLRFMSKQAVLEKAIEPKERKFLKPLSAQTLKPGGRSNLKDIFAGTVDKGIFEYPTVATDESIDTVLNHCKAVENVLHFNQNCNLTKEVITKLKELELFGLSAPQEFGGAGYNETETKFIHECTAINPKIGRFIGYKEDFGCRLVTQFGTDEQKKIYLPDLVRGKRLMTLAYLERSPIIDISKLETYITKTETSENFTLNGKKNWVHFADKADLFLVMAKLPSIDNTQTEFLMKFHMLIIGKNTPGVTVHRLKSESANKADLYEVTFNNVSVPSTNILGGLDIDGFKILKSGLSHSNLTDATLCLSLMKQMLHEGIQYIEENDLKDPTVRTNIHLNETTALFVTYTYALESAIYLLAGSYDMYEKWDLFNDSIMTKVLAIDFLQVAINFYIDIIGRESFKKSGLLDTALEAVQYHSTLDENIEHFKLMSGAEGLIASSAKFAKNVKILRNQYDHPYEAIKLSLNESSNKKKFKSSLKYKMELHESLQEVADSLEESMIKMQTIIKNLFLVHGNLAMHSELSIIKLTEIASYLFACFACLSRASFSICYEVNNYNNECLLAQIFLKLMETKIHAYLEDEKLGSLITQFSRHIGKNVFTVKEYPLEHPLSRAY